MRLPVMPQAKSSFAPNVIMCAANRKSPAAIAIANSVSA